NLCERGEFGRGLLWLGRSLEFAPTADPALRQSLRTLLGGWVTQFHPLRAVLQHDGVVRAVAFSPDGRTIVTGSNDGTARLWVVGTSRAAGEPLRHDGPVRAVAFSPDGRTLATGSDDSTARLWQAATGRPVGEVLRHQGEVQAVVFSPDGR